MKIDTHIDRQRNLRTHRVDGLIHVGELETLLAQFYASPDFDPDMNALWDLRSADTSAVTGDEVRSLADRVRQHWESSRSRAALVATDDLNFGLSRMYERLVGNPATENVRVFKDYEAAEKWLTK